MAVQIMHDGFGRWALMRAPVSKEYGPLTCKWCGEKAKFYYQPKDDANNRPLEWGWCKPFCSVGCWRAYNR